MKGKCNCGKKAVVEFMNYLPSFNKRKRGVALSMKFCNACRPKRETNTFFIIDRK